MLKKRKHKFMAFLLSAMMLITGTAMGAAPAAAAEKSPPTLKSCSANFGYDFRLSFDTSTDAEWISKITSVTVAGESWTKGNTSSSVWNNKSYYVNSDKQILIGEGFTDTTATCVISADGYSNLTLTLNKSGHTATVVTAETAQTYKITTAATTHGAVTVDQTSAKKGDTVTITAVPDTGYSLKALTAADRSEKNSSITESKFQMPASDVTITAVFEKKAADAEKDTLRVCAQPQLQVNSRFTARCEPALLRRLAKTGALQELVLGKAISFRYADGRMMRSLQNDGIWLELSCFFAAREAGIFCDVRTSVVVEWTVSEEKETPPTRNEIDVMCVTGTMPVFISCKMASPSPLALSEIEVLCRRFGGEAARAVVVTAAEPRRDSPAIYQRAKDLGITLIGGDVLRTGKLAQCLRRAAT